MKAVQIIIAIVLGLVGLGMSVCGVGFTLVGMSGGEATGVLILAVPSLLLGCLLIWVATKVRKSASVPVTPPAQAQASQQPEKKEAP